MRAGGLPPGLLPKFQKKTIVGSRDTLVGPRHHSLPRGGAPVSAGDKDGKGAARKGAVVRPPGTIDREGSTRQFVDCADPQAARLPLIARLAARVQTC